MRMLARLRASSGFPACRRRSLRTKSGKSGERLSPARGLGSRVRTKSGEWPRTQSGIEPSRLLARNSQDSLDANGQQVARPIESDMAHVKSFCSFVARIFVAQSMEEAFATKYVLALSDSTGNGYAEYGSNVVKMSSSGTKHVLILGLGASLIHASKGNRPSQESQDEVRREA